jgi:hypothetical protein
MGESYDKETIKIIKSVFPKIVIEDKTISIFKNKSSIESFLGLFKKKSINDSCFDFVIENNYIYIKYLSKCGDIKGYNFLEKISILAITLTQNGKEINYIKLQDKSLKYICKKAICLRTIKILTTGISWYNKFDYFSKNYINEKQSNQIIIEKKYTDFLNDLQNSLITSYEKKYQQRLAILTKRLEELEFNTTEKLNEYEIELLSKEKQEHIINYEKKKKEEFVNFEYYKNTDVKILFPNVNIDVNTITVKDFFNSIWIEIITNSKKNNCQNKKFIKQLDWLKHFIRVIIKSNILIYDIELMKEIKPFNNSIKIKYLKYKNKYLNLKNQLG